MTDSDYELPTHRSLKAFAYDPSLGRAGTMVIQIPYEDVEPGPQCKPGLFGEGVRVVDYDASNDCYYPPVDLNHPSVLFNAGLDPSESDPRFHQQMVYAVVKETMERFRFALGRPVKWHRTIDGTLTVYPHGMQDANAYYSRQLGALAFGYFRASEDAPGSNLPGQVVFTCLSHDIVAHEATHALIDGQKSFFLEDTSLDTPAFHEAFADIVALFLHFTHKDALVDIIRRTGGLIYRPEIAPGQAPGADGPLIQQELSTENPLVKLAQQFGEAMGTRKALRSALGTKPNSSDLERKTEPHERGSILVAAVFDAFFSIYMNRTRDLMRISRAAGGADGGDLHPDLVERLAGEAMKTAEHFGNICIRALDYCPPVDIQFGDFLRAMIASDHSLVPDDPHGYRRALIEAFRSRGIRPRDVASYAEDSLCWSPPMWPASPEPCKGLSFDLINPPTPEENEDNAKRLWGFAQANREALLLTKGPKISVLTFRPLKRVSPDGQLKIEVVAELMQRYDNVRLDPNDSASPKFTFHGGTTVVLDGQGNVLYAIGKPLGLDDPLNPRLRAQREHYLGLDSVLANAAYQSNGRANGRPVSHLDNGTSMRFDFLHRGF